MESSKNSKFLTPDSRLRTPDFLISVTQALSPYADFSSVPPHVLRRAAARGNHGAPYLRGHHSGALGDAIFRMNAWNMWNLSVFGCRPWRK